MQNINVEIACPCGSHRFGSVNLNGTEIRLRKPPLTFYILPGYVFFMINNLRTWIALLRDQQMFHCASHRKIQKGSEGRTSDLNVVT